MAFPATAGESKRGRRGDDSPPARRRPDRASRLNSRLVSIHAASRQLTRVDPGDDNRGGGFRGYCPAAKSGARPLRFVAGGPGAVQNGPANIVQPQQIPDAGAARGNAGRSTGPAPRNWDSAKKMTRPLLRETGPRSFWSQITLRFSGIWTDMSPGLNPATAEPECHGLPPR